MAKQVIDLGTTTNDGTGTPIRDAGEMINDNFTELYDAKRFGIYDYNNSSGIQSLTGPSTIVLENDGAGANTYKNILPGVAEVFDVSTDEFDFSGLAIGDVVNIRIELEVETTVVNQEVECYITLNQGGTPYTILLFRNQYKVAAQYPVNATTFIYIGNTGTKNNPAQLMLASEDDCNVDVKGWVLKIDKQVI